MKNLEIEETAYTSETTSPSSCPQLIFFPKLSLCPTDSMWSILLGYKGKPDNMTTVVERKSS